MVTGNCLLSSRLSSLARISFAIIVFGAMIGNSASAQTQAAYVRVNQIGYEISNPPFRAYLMSTAPETGAKFNVIDSEGRTVYSHYIGALLGTWSHSAKMSYQVYALDFTVAENGIYAISVSGPVPASSPQFAVDEPDVLYAGLLLNTLFFYQSERDGPNFVRNALRTAPGHLKDQNARVYETPPLDSNDFIDNAPPAVAACAGKASEYQRHRRLVGRWRLYEICGDDQLHGRLNGNRNSRFSEPHGLERARESSRSARLDFLRRK